MAGQQKLSDDVFAIRVHLENITDRTIKIVAEGHTDLSRKLDEAVKVRSERELLLVRMNFLEGEITKVKRRLPEEEVSA